MTKMCSLDLNQMKSVSDMSEITGFSNHAAWWSACCFMTRSSTLSTGITIEEVTALRPWCCLSLGVILLHLNPPIIRGFRASDCVSVLCVCVCVCVSVCAEVLFPVVLRWGNDTGKCQAICWQKKVIHKTTFWKSCLHWAWCCFFDLLGFKTN